MKHMHCLGAAVTGGTPSPNGVASRGSILSVFRALGVLVCEGRIQGPPRGYKEGPHCTPPFQSQPNDHACEKEDYLCDRYHVLLQEIADRAAIGSFLCVEVVLCADCPCGLAKATCKNPLTGVPSLSVSGWQHASEMLLEYWCICVVPSKSPETMNFQGLYQAVRSRLHFSQVAAWWSRSNGIEPSYIATRLVPHNEDNLRKFREAPIEHTFPLAGNGDGNSIKVTVWALPRTEEVPVLTCPIHPTKEKDEESVARALTPTKAIPVPPSASQNPEALVLPVLVDDRLQTPCNRPGKHHCRCEEEEVSPPSPSLPRPNGERKRRRSLPCGPTDLSTPPGTNRDQSTLPLPSVQELTVQEPQEASQSSSYPRSSSDMSNNNRSKNMNFEQSELIEEEEENSTVRLNNLNTDNLERCFVTRLSIEESDGNLEKRYKRSVEHSQEQVNLEPRLDGIGGERACCESERNEKPVNRSIERTGLFENFMPFASGMPWSSFVESWSGNGNAGGRYVFQNLRGKELELQGQDCKSVSSRDSQKQPSAINDSNSGISWMRKQYLSFQNELANEAVRRTTEEPVSPGQEALESDPRKFIADRAGNSSRDLNKLMSKLSFVEEEKDKSKEDRGLFDWFSKVPGRVLGVTPSNGYVDRKTKGLGRRTDGHCRVDANGLNSNLDTETDTAGNVHHSGGSNLTGCCSIEYRVGCSSSSGNDSTGSPSSSGSSSSSSTSSASSSSSGGSCSSSNSSSRRSTSCSNTSSRSCSSGSSSGGKMASEGNRTGGGPMDPKLKNRNLELSEREFNEVLAVLRSRTPSDRRRTTLKALKKREKLEKSPERTARYAGFDSINDQTNNILNRVQLCEGCTHRLCKKNDAQDFGKLASFNQMYNNKNIYYPCDKIQDRIKSQNGRSRDNNPWLETCSDPGPDDARSISSNKADILLSAILRTSKDRKGLSNGSKGNQLFGSSNGEIDKETVGGQDRKMVRDSTRSPLVENFEGEKPLPLPLQLPFNKRFNRLRQLFKKEQDKKMGLQPEAGSGENCHQSAASFNFHENADVSSNDNKKTGVCGSKSSRARKKINFTNVQEESDSRQNRYGYRIGSSERLSPEPSTNGAHQNSRIYSTNYKGNNYNYDLALKHSSASTEPQVRRDSIELYSTKINHVLESEEPGLERRDCLLSGIDQEKGDDLLEGVRLVEADQPDLEKKLPGDDEDDEVEEEDLDEEEGGIENKDEEEDRPMVGRLRRRIRDTSNTDRALRRSRVAETAPRLVRSFLKLRSRKQPVLSVTEDEEEAVDKGVPSAIEQEKFRRSLENAASMVFHSRTGLPLTSSPAPLRRGSCCFDYDSSLNSVSSKRSALFELNTPPSPGAVSLEETDRETESTENGEVEETTRKRSSSRSRPQSHALLGSFEESALNGRLEPVSTVHGFTAELGASGSFCPKHQKLPVTVFFYTLGDNDKVSTPYLAHINLGKKGYQVPRSGTIQVTLLNPSGTVVKMFVVLYDLSDMPPRSHTFLRQRTLRDKTLRYLVHLRFMSGKSGRIYLHTDIRMIICRKSDVDTASDFGSEPPKELRSYIHGPTNPKFSPRC